MFLEQFKVLDVSMVYKCTDKKNNYLNPQSNLCHYFDNSSEQLGTVHVYNMTISES